MINRREIMKAAWTRHNTIATAQGRPFCRRRFTSCLREAWAKAKLAAFRAAQTPAAPEPIELRERIEALRFLPFSVNIATEAQRIRAQYSAAA